MDCSVKLKEREWNKLISKIEREEVILVLGDQLSMLNINGQRVPLKDYILANLVEALNSEERDPSRRIEMSDVTSFSDVSYEYKKERWQSIGSDPYTETAEVLANISPRMYETESLSKLLSISQFKTILTTSFDDIAYSVLKSKYGEGSVMNLGYVRRTNGQDIPQRTDKRIIYHIFGKPSSEQHSYVLSEDDLLEFIHFWMDQNYRPKELSNKLSDKYILALGCNYPDWLFRFFFHSLKYNSTLRNECRDNGLLADRNLDMELISFLRRMEASAHEDAISFIDELCERWEKRNRVETVSEAPETESQDEAFISYANEDYDTVADISSIFLEMGFKVWFDKRNLEGGDKYEKLIKDKISKAKVFIPVISANTENSTGPRFFRKEWTWAKKAEEAHYGTEDNFIRPILIDGIQLTDSHVFGDCHGVDMSNPDERRNAIRRMIRNMRK